MRVTSFCSFVLNVIVETPVYLISNGGLSLTDTLKPVQSIEGTCDERIDIFFLLFFSGKKLYDVTNSVTSFVSLRLHLSTGPYLE